MEYVNVTTQAELEKAVEAGIIPICRNGFFSASGSATVQASGSATVQASGSATVQASKFVAVTRHGTAAKVNGGVLIQIPEIKSAQDFLDFYGVKASRGSVVLYKLVDDEFVSDHGTSYRLGEKPTAADWNARPSCGEGLHFSPRPFMARLYASGSRFVACRVKLADLVVISDYGTRDKCKAKACTVLYECDEDGTEIKEAKAA